MFRISPLARTKERDKMAFIVEDLPMRPSILATALLLSTFVRADDWELSLFQSTQKTPSRGALSSTTADPHGFRLGYAVGKGEPVSFRLEGTWMPRNSVQVLEEGTQQMVAGDLANTSATLSLRGEAWFWRRFACVSMSVDERLNWVEYIPVNGSPAMGHGPSRLPQTWARIGLGGRIWFFGMADFGREPDSSWYPILRLEWAAAVTPKGRGDAAELLPRQEFTFSLGFRF